MRWTVGEGTVGDACPYSYVLYIRIRMKVMKMSELKNRKTPRCKGFDYNSVGAYFITICTQDRRCVLSHIVGTGVPDCPRPTRNQPPIVGTGVPDDPCRYNDEPNIAWTGVLDCPRPTRDQPTIVGTGVPDCPRPCPRPTRNQPPIVGTGIPDDSCRYNDESNIVGTGVLDCPRRFNDEPPIVGTGVPDDSCRYNDEPNIVGTGVLDCPRPHPQTNNVHLELTTYGEIADKYIRQLNDFYDHLSIEDYVIMPNHIHLLLCVKENMCGGMSEKGQSGTPVPTNIERANSACSRFVSTFKRFCNKEYGGNIWQARFNDHIIRNCDDYDRHMNYIRENPIRWYCDELYTR